MSDPNTLFAGICAAAVVGSGFSSYFGMKYGLNGMRDRVERIERHTDVIPQLQQDVAVLKALKEEERRRNASGEREHL